MPLSNRSKQSQSVGSELQSSDGAIQTEQNEIENDILAFCELEIEKTNSKINKAYRDGKEIRNIDMTQKALKTLMPAKLSLSLIIRAIKKRDYMIL